MLQRKPQQWGLHGSIAEHSESFARTTMLPNTRAITVALLGKASMLRHHAPSNAIEYNARGVPMRVTGRSLERALRFFSSKAWKRVCVAHNKRMAKR